MRARAAIGVGLVGLAAFGLGLAARALVGGDDAEEAAPTSSTSSTSPATSTPATPSTSPTAPTAASPPEAEAEAPPAEPRPARVEHVAYRFVDNRHAAHRLVGEELVIDAAHAGFARYLRFGVPQVRWRLGQVVDGVRASVAERVALLEIPLGGEQAARVTHVVMRVHGRAGQALVLKVNGRAAGKQARVALADGWQTIAFPVEPRRLGGGENQLALETTGARGEVAVAWLRFGADPGDLAAAADPRAAAAFDARAETVTLARDASLVWYLTIPDGAHLVTALASPDGAPCKVEVQARASDEGIAGALLTPDDGRFDLSPMAGRVVALELTARDCPAATLRAPRITLHGPTPAPRPRAAPPRYVVLWVMDALRADRVPVFTPGARAQTPNFDELARTSAVFRQYYVQGNESQTSHSSVWSGVYPAVHGVRLAGRGGVSYLSAKLPVLAGQLAAAGMFTTAVTGNGFINADNGYARGFTEYRNMMREAGVLNGVIYGKRLVDAALGQLDRRRDQPTYLYFGTIDTHAPWIARRPWIDIYSPGPYDGPFKEFGTAKDLGFQPGRMGCAIIPPKRDIERLRAIYDSAISYQDRELGRFVAQLKAWGIWDQTLLIVTADHGEELFEDGRCGHGGSLRETLVRVPLLVHDPARFPGGTVIDEGAEGVDVMPTVLDAVGAPPVESAQGASLVPLAQGVGRGWPTPSYASQYEYAHAMRIGRWKIRVGTTGTAIVGDLHADPGERVDHAFARQVERRMLADHLGTFLHLRRQWNKRVWGPVTNVTAAGAAALDEASTP